MLANACDDHHIAAVRRGTADSEVAPETAPDGVESANEELNVSLVEDGGAAGVGAVRYD